MYLVGREFVWIIAECQIQIMLQIYFFIVTFWLIKNKCDCNGKSQFEIMPKVTNKARWGNSSFSWDCPPHTPKIWEGLLCSYLNFFNNEENPAVQNMIALLRQAHVYPSSYILTRLESLNDNLGHICPCRRTGGQQTEQFAGQDLFFLALYCLVYPKCAHSEINIFLYWCNLGNSLFQFYSHLSKFKSRDFDWSELQYTRYC